MILFMEQEPISELLSRIPSKDGVELVFRYKTAEI
jgi:hypothetical protein